MDCNRPQLTTDEESGGINDYSLRAYYLRKKELMEVRRVTASTNAKEMKKEKRWRFNYITRRCYKEIQGRGSGQLGINSLHAKKRGKRGTQNEPLYVFFLCSCLVLLVTSKGYS